MSQVYFCPPLNTFLNESLPDERLAITLRYLVMGDSMQMISFSYHVGHSTVSGIIDNNCDALWDSLQPHYMPKPSSSAAWKNVSEGFEHAWNFLHCVGVIDGKHIVMQAPAHSGSTFYNYKGTHSIVLCVKCTTVSP